MTLICVDAKDKTLDQVGRDFEAAVKKQGFGILTVHNIKETLTKKGVKYGTPSKSTGFGESKQGDSPRWGQARNRLTFDMQRSM